MSQTALKRILQNIRNARSILLITHEDPDADALGSTLSCKLLLETLNKKVLNLYITKTDYNAVWKKLADFHPKTIHTAEINTLAHRKKNMFVFQGAPRQHRPTLDLANFDFALVLDTSYSDNNITGLKFKSKPLYGVGTIDHHSRSDTSYEQSQDYNIPDASSTCELVYDLIPKITLKEHLTALSPNLRNKIADLLLAGILDDMVGLTVREKLTDKNLQILHQLKKLVGKKRFKDLLTESRTILVPQTIAPYTKYLTHHLIKDKNKREFHLYFLKVPSKHAKQLKSTYSSIITLFEHYARTGCEKEGKNYGMFVMTIDDFDQGMTKFSARGPLIKPIFTENSQVNKLFLSYGISGNSAMGGKISKEMAKTFKNDFLSTIKTKAKKIELSSRKLDNEIQKELNKLVA